MARLGNIAPDVISVGLAVDPDQIVNQFTTKKDPDPLFQTRLARDIVDQFSARPVGHVDPGLGQCDSLKRIGHVACFCGIAL